MEFFIRKNATLPILQVDVIKDGKLDYNFKLETLSSSTVTFSMVDVDTNFYKVANALCTYESETNSVYYQFTKRNTKNIGRYEGEFKVTNSQGSVILPLRDRLYVNVIDSFVDPDFCCVGGNGGYGWGGGGGGAGTTGGRGGYGGDGIVIITSW